MGHRLRPKQISDTARFAQEMEAMLLTLRPYVSGLRVSSEHYRLVEELNAKVLDTLKAVTGDGPSWARNFRVFSPEDLQKLGYGDRS